MRIALTRSPGADLPECELSFREREPIDVERAREQHAAYRALLEELGCTVTVLPALEGHPDAVFLEDAALVLDDVAILIRPGSERRRAEVEALAPALEHHRPLERLSAPSTLDGGDVLRIGDVLHVGQSARTNHAGLKELAHAVLPHGLRVKAIDVRGCLHLKSACTFLGPDPEEGTLLVHADWIDAARLSGHPMIPIDPREPFGANALVVGGTVMLPASAPRTAERVAARGFEVRLVELGELEKAEAGPTCLSLVFESRAGGAPATDAG